MIEGAVVGAYDGMFVGVADGSKLGAAEGARVGSAVGCAVGPRVGDSVGFADGATVGGLDGAVVAMHCISLLGSATKPSLHAHLYGDDLVDSKLQQVYSYWTLSEVPPRLRWTRFRYSSVPHCILWRSR